MLTWLMVVVAVLVGLLLLLVLWSCLVMAAIVGKAEEAAARITGWKPVPPRAGLGKPLGEE